jgi:elongator complex protein 3
MSVLLMNFEDACRAVIQEILTGSVDASQLNRLKKRIAKQSGLNKLPGNAELLKFCSEEQRGELLHLLQKKPVRTISGVAVLAAMTSPAPCPHGKCTPCPGGPDTRFKSAQSYMGSEPASLRAIEHSYHPYRQVAARIHQLQTIGHPVDKAELIIMGGTFTARDAEYQRWFVKGCLAAMNDAGEKPSNFEAMSLWKVQQINERARVRNVGMTIETRPDYLREHHLNTILELGATKVEMGVQTIDDTLLKNIHRGHTVRDVIEANRRLRDTCFKIGFHMMPGLPGSDVEKDLEVFRELFENPDFRPDYLKIYPTLVTEGTELEKLWREGRYTPLGDAEAVELIARIKAILPPYVRLQRVQRDIPAHQILAGIKKSHIRQLAAKRLSERGESCQCIRCREAGHRKLKGLQVENIAQQIHTYEACGGVEHFISYEDANQTLVGFLRLRYPYKPYRRELQGAALIRELHIYGRLTPLGEKPDVGGWQHLGYGERLIKTAEELSEREGYRKIAVISGIGVREYYRRLGYRREGAYMVKELNTLQDRLQLC